MNLPRMMASVTLLTSVRCVMEMTERQCQRGKIFHRVTGNNTDARVAEEPPPSMARLGIRRPRLTVGAIRLLEPCGSGEPHDHLADTLVARRLPLDLSSVRVQPDVDRCPTLHRAISFIDPRVDVRALDLVLHRLRVILGAQIFELLNFSLV